MMLPSRAQGSSSSSSPSFNMRSLMAITGLCLLTILNYASKVANNHYYDDAGRRTSTSSSSSTPTAATSIRSRIARGALDGLLPPHTQQQEGLIVDNRRKRKESDNEASRNLVTLGTWAPLVPTTGRAAVPGFIDHNETHQQRQTLQIDIVSFDNRPWLQSVQLTKERMIQYVHQQDQQQRAGDDSNASRETTSYRYYHFTRSVFDDANEISPKFNKYAYILQVMEDYNEEGKKMDGIANDGEEDDNDNNNNNANVEEQQWVVWVDTDIMIADLNFRFESIIERYAHQETELIVSRDYRWEDHTFIINNGIFLIRNTKWSRQFLRKVIRLGPNRDLDKWYGYPNLVDQPFMTFMLHDLLNVIPWRTTAETEITQKVSLIANRQINAFCRPYEPYSTIWELDQNATTHLYHHGDPIIHFLGLPNEEYRVIAMQRMLSVLNKNDNKDQQHQHSSQGIRSSPKSHGVGIDEPLYNPCLDYSYLPILPGHHNDVVV